MPRCLFDRATSLYVGGTMHDDLVHDDALFVQVVLPVYPNPRAQRWDGAQGVRPSTAAELAQYDQVQLDGAAQQDLQAQKAIKAVLIYLMQRLNELRTTPVQVLPALTQADVIQGVTQIYKGL